MANISVAHLLIFGFMALSSAQQLSSSEAGSAYVVFSYWKPIADTWGTTNWTSSDYLNLCNETRVGLTCTLNNGLYVITNINWSQKSPVQQLASIIPSEIGGLLNLTGLLLSGNSLYGSLPSSLSNTGLQTLDLTDNDITGCSASSLVIPTLVTCRVAGNKNLDCTCIPDACRSSCGAAGNQTNGTIDWYYILVAVVGGIAVVWGLLGVLVGVTTGNWCLLAMCLIFFRRR
eukprot:TRINITY_DN12424_c0_g1_i1.p1 TRINITY_DN12424_c0_g1~~TRINITY_DN12424_c0_g1_i1.p1  ORF type:complete len:231 (-),score=40.04 TRINITY_DN12424_c0_g1_i1:66-758(-)